MMCRTYSLRNLTGVNTEVTKHLWISMQNEAYLPPWKFSCSQEIFLMMAVLTCSKEHDCNWSVEPPPRSHADGDQPNQESYENNGSTTQQQSQSSYLPV